MKCLVQNPTAGSMERGWEHLRLRRAAVPVRPEAPVLCTCAEGFPARHGREQFSTSAQKTDTVPPAHLPVFRARLRRAGTSVSRPERSPRSCPGQGFPRCWPAELTPSGDGQNAGPGTAHGQNGARGRERGRVLRGVAGLQERAPDAGLQGPPSGRSTDTA